MARKSSATHNRKTRKRRRTARRRFAHNDPDEWFFEAEEWVEFGIRYSLSGRELSVLVLTCRNFTRAEIADELGVTINTVHKYCDRLHKKVGVDDRFGLALTVLHFILAEHSSTRTG